MKFAVNRLDFIRILEPTVKVASGKQMAILGNVLLTAESGRIKACGYNLSVAVTASAAAAIDESGAACIDGHAIAAFLQKCDEPNVIVDTADMRMNVKCGKAKTSLMYALADDYPKAESLSNTANEVTLKTSELFDAVKTAGYAAAENCPRKELECINISINKNGIKIISCDGNRAAVYTKKSSCDIPEAASFGLFKNDVKTVMSIITSENMTLRYNDKHLEFSGGGISVMTSLSAKQYPNIEALVEKSTKTVSELITVDSSELKETLSKITALPKIGVEVPVRIDVGHDKMQFLYNFGNGIFTDEIECKLDGDPFTVGVKTMFLSDMLKSADGSITLNCNGPAGAITLQSENISQMIMPMRLKK